MPLEALHHGVERGRPGTIAVHGLVGIPSNKEFLLSAYALRGDSLRSLANATLRQQNSESLGHTKPG